MDTPYTQWITAQLARLGEGVKHIGAVRSGEASAVFAVITNVQRYYFKTCGSYARGWRTTTCPKPSSMMTFIRRT